MVDEAKGSCEVIVGGTVYDKMLSMNLRRSTQEGCCSGTIVLSWPGAEQFNTSGLILKEFVEGADGQIRLDGQLAATIRFDTRNSKGTPKSYELTLHFRGQPSDLIDGMPDHDTGQINNKQPKQILEELMKGSNTKLIDMTQGGGLGNMIKRFIVAEGETTERACRRAARNYGLKFWENEEGNWVLSDGKGAEMGGSELRLGHNFTQWTTQRSLSQRYSDNNLWATGIPTDQQWGKVTESLVGTGLRTIGGGFGGGAGMMGKRLFRGFIDGDHTKESAEKTAEFNQNQRAGQGLNVSLKLSTWTDNAGKLWKVYRKYRVVIPVDEIDDELTCKEVEFELTPESRNATITLESDSAGSSSAPPDTGGRALTDPGRQATPPQEPQQQQPAPQPPPPSQTPAPSPQEQAMIGNISGSVATVPKPPGPSGS